MDVIRRDIKTLYAMQMFDDIRVDEEQGRTGKIIIFVVKEKALVRSIKYEGLKSITTSEVLDKLREKKVGLSQESQFDPTRIKRAEDVIKSMLAEKGHQDATDKTITETHRPGAGGRTDKV